MFLCTSLLSLKYYIINKIRFLSILFLLKVLFLVILISKYFFLCLNAFSRPFKIINRNLFLCPRYNIFSYFSDYKNDSYICKMFFFLYFVCLLPSGCCLLSIYFFICVLIYLVLLSPIYLGLLLCWRFSMNVLLS